MVELLAGSRQKRETTKAVQACNDWIRLGPGRSLPDLLEKYTALNQDEPPTLSLATLKHWSSVYDWQKRAEAYDAEIERQKNEYRQQVLQTGLALDYERVIKLKRLADFLISQIYERDENGAYHNVWLPDVKQIGSGDQAERVDIERFNAPIIDQFRGVLDDLAKETGGRRKRNDNLNIDLRSLSDEQLERVANGEDPFYVVATTSSQGNT